MGRCAPTMLLFLQVGHRMASESHSALGVFYTDAEAAPEIMLVRRAELAHKN